MASITEAYIRKMVREILSESMVLEISAEEKEKAYAKSNERVPFNVELMKQAILQGREIGMNFRSKNDKYEMPTTKTRIVHPVAMGTNKNGDIIIRGLHIIGQSEKVAIDTGIRSAEAEASKDGINAWRLFRADNLKSMWFTDRFFSDNIPGYNPADKAMSTKMAVYDPAKAKAYQDGLSTPMEPKFVRPEENPQSQNEVPVDTKSADQIGYEDQPIQEKKNNRKGFFK